MAGLNPGITKMSKKNVRHDRFVRSFQARTLSPSAEAACGGLFATPRAGRVRARQPIFARIGERGTMRDKRFGQRHAVDAWATIEDVAS